MTQCSCRDDAADINVQIVSKTPYDVEMKRKYAKHLKTTERYPAGLLHASAGCGQ